MLPQFKVIVAGGRNFNDYDYLESKLNYYLSKKRNEGYNIIIISGTANGADSLGERYANNKGYDIKRYPAQWDKYGKSAGYKRNVEMANVADACIVFWDGISRGSKHMIDIAKTKKLPLKIVNY